MQYYRLRIRNAADSADELVLTSLPGGINPYISAPPHADGSSIDPATGDVVTGALNVQVIDAGSVVTSVLADANARQQLLARRAYVESSADGAVWVMFSPGYVNAVRLVTALVYEFAIGDSRRVEVSRDLFKSVLLRRNAATGAPVFSRFSNATNLIGSAVNVDFGPMRNYGGWIVKVANVVPDAGGLRGYVQLKLVSGFDPRKSNSATYLAAFERPNIASKAIINYTNEQAYPHFRESALYRNNIKGTFPGMFYYLVPPGAVATGRFLPLAEPMGEGVKRGDYITRPGESSFWVDWTRSVQEDGTTLAAPAAGTLYHLFLSAYEISEANPLHVSGHPVDLFEQTCLETGIAYDASVLAAVKATLGNDLYLELRFTGPMKVGEFWTKVLFGPFGLATRVNDAGQLVLITTRIKDAASPASIITINELRSADDIVFDLDESSVANKVVVKQQKFTPWDPDSDSQPSADGIDVQPQTVEVENGEANSPPGDHDVTHEIPGTILWNHAPMNLEDFAVGIAAETFARAGRGAPRGTLHCLPTVTAKLGEEVILDLVHLPNALLGQVPVSQRGGQRIVQVVRRTPTPSGPDLEVLDAGTLVQAAVAPAFTITALAADPRKYATIALTNAAALAAAGLLVRIEIATGAGAPTSGTLLTVLNPANASTVTPPAFDAGTKVWARMRSEKLGHRPSAWTAWGSVQLTALDAVTGLAVSAESAADISRRTLTWTNGANAGDMPVEVRARLSTDTAASDRVLAVLPAGSTRYELTGLTVATRVVTVRHKEQAPAGGYSADSSINVVTSGAGLAALPAPVNPFAFADGLGGYGIEVTASALPSNVEVQVAVGLGGAFAALATVPSAEGERTSVEGLAPNDGQVRRLRARHTWPGQTESAWTAEVSVNPWSVVAPVDPTAANPPYAYVRAIAPTTRRYTTAEYTGDLGDAGAGPLQYRRRIVIEGVSVGVPSAWAALGAGVTEVIPADPYHDISVYAQTMDANGNVSEEAPLFITASSDQADGAGTGAGMTEEGRTREGEGGVMTPKGRIFADALYLRDGSGPIIVDTGQIQAVATMPGGTGVATTETGGNRAVAAIDSGNVAVAGAVDFARSYTGKHLGNVPDDATTDRRSATATQKTGGDRGASAIDAGLVVVPTALDFSRSYTGKHLGNLPDDATTDRKAVSGNEKTGASRGYSALDAAALLKTGVTTTATAKDGLAGIGSERFAARQGGHAGTGTVYEGFVRAGLGGVPVPGGAIYGNDLYTADGSTRIIDASVGSFVGAFTAGASGITPRASFRFTPQSPSISFSDGDFWYSSAANAFQCRVAGATKTVTVT